MNLILIIGHTGQGKSTYLQKFIAGRKQYIFDVNNEYNLPDDLQVRPQMRNRDLNVNRFLSICKGLKNYNICFEDATGFLRGKQQKELSQLIVAKRHTGNNFIFLFHSINRVPPELMEMSNYVILFKTNDNIDLIDRKFKNEKLNNAFLQLQKMKNHSFIEINTI